MYNKDNTHSLPVLQPDYYSTFSCLASKCPDTCCKGWIIEIEPETHANWCHAVHNKSTELPLAEHIGEITRRNNISQYHIQMNDSMECPLLTPDGLCSVVLAHGDDMIPKICRDYPRQQTECNTLIQRSVAVRCAPVLDLLWKNDEFHYRTDGDPGFVSFPAQKLLDGFLKIGNEGDHSSSEYLKLLFCSLYQEHAKLAAQLPCDANGLRDYGQELITEENSLEVLSYADNDNAFVNDSYRLAHCINIYHRLHSHHDLMYDMIQNFYDSPVFGPDFLPLFHQSRNILEQIKNETENSLPVSPSIQKEYDHKLKLLIMEELFTSVFSIETTDYETVLIRLQWLIVQYLVINHLLFLDVCRGIQLDEEHVKFRITRIFRVSDLPDILKISFFDPAFREWLWKPAKLHDLLH